MPTSKPFRFGVINERMGTAYGWRERAQRAETLGYATFLLRDHFVTEPFGDQFAPLIALMAAANATTRLRVGTLVLDNDYRHPVMLAKEAATLDALSGGRFELGLGAGWLRDEYAAAGMDYAPNGVRIDRLTEAIAIIKGLFGAEPVSFAGEHYRVTSHQNYPLPVQQPGPPLLIGAGKPRMLRLAGQHADIVGFLTTSVASGTMEDDPTERLAEAVAQKIAWVREGAGARFDQIELSLIPTIIITDDRDGAIARLIAERGWTGITPEQVAAMPAVLIGTIPEIARTFQARREQYGFSYYIVPDSQLEECAPLVATLAGR